MSLVTLQLGQCGNQIGGQFFTTLADDIRFGPNGRSSHVDHSYDETCIDRFFSVDSSGKWIARAVMVDMEQKVRPFHDSIQWRYIMGYMDRTLNAG
jgi:Tubulin/FtsZ family, GTPase domain